MRSLVDLLGDEVLAGSTLEEALQDIIKRVLLVRQARRARDDLIRQTRDRQREIRTRGQLSGILEQTRSLIDSSVEQERQEISSRTGDKIMELRARLDALSTDEAESIRQLANHDWQSPAAQRTFQRLRLFLLGEIIDSQFYGISRLLQNRGLEIIPCIKVMLRDLNNILLNSAHGEHVSVKFTDFTETYADLLPNYPQELEEFSDILFGRLTATEYVVQSLSERQRKKVADLATDALDNAGLAAEMARLTAAIRARRPTLDYAATPDATQISGERPLGLSDAATALEELTHLTELTNILQRASLNDIDEENAARLLERYAAGGLQGFGRIAGELMRQGYLRQGNKSLELTPKAVRRLGDSILDRIFANMNRSRQGGEHDQPIIGNNGEPTDGTRPWEFGDDQPLDISATLRNALFRNGRMPIKIAPQDFEVVQAERRSSAAVSLLLDMSYSMALRGCWPMAKQAALALLSLLRNSFPQDKVQILGFSNYARELSEVELAGLGWDMVQGTNLHHALVMAGKHLDSHPTCDPIVIIVTDGEPTAHLQADGRPWFDWPPSAETMQLTMAEVDNMARRQAELSIFLLAEDDRLEDFADDAAKRTRGRVIQVSDGRLGKSVILDFIRTRKHR